MNKSDKWVGRSLLLVFIAAIIVLLVQRFSIMSVFSNWFKPKPVMIDNTPLVIKEIKAIAELNTVMMYQELVIDSVAMQPGRIPAIVNPFTFHVLPLLTKKEIVLIVRGKVKAGVDLKNLPDKNVFVHDDSVSIILPRAVITDVFINPSDVETFYENGSWSNEEVTAVKQSARRKLIAEAGRRQLLQKADDKAKAVLEQFLKTAQFKKITISSR